MYIPFWLDRQCYVTSSRGFGKCSLNFGIWYKELDACVIFPIHFIPGFFFSRGKLDPHSKDNSGVKTSIHLKADWPLLSRQAWGVLTEWAATALG